MVVKKCPTCNSSKFKKHVGEQIWSCKKCGYELRMSVTIK